MNILKYKSTKLVIASVLLAGFTTASFAAERVYTWKLATTWGPTLSPFIDAPHQMAKMVEEMSDGRLVIRIDASNKHKAALGVFDMVKGGQYDMAHSASYYWKGKDINTLPFTTMPFGMTTPEQYAWFYEGGGMELMQKAYAPHKILSFPGGNTGNQMGGWFRKEINSLEDLKGLKMRIPGFAGEVMAKLGVAVTNIPSGELYTSLERGVLDALEWVGPGMDVNMGFHKVAPFYYTGWHEPATELQYLVNERKFDRLPKDLQVILKTAMKLSAYDMYIKNYAMSAEALSEMDTKYPNIKVMTFPKPVMDAMKKANSELIAEITKENPLLKEVIDSQTAFQKKARAWTIMSDYNYLKDNLQ
ncbi:ABC transporter substrate-binding protein [Psychromonas sp. MB-3u-54]|uniref:TRAP transporter substrate-binding protein n=1 Tax=Psychromonas sp. MB-3u-54 TaxID=2058319 RepID=UPI000C3211D4|nr:TRAP transporter substrate-binding protein [Psychromonas sp. MB-3u-54]PKH01949.1 ABC transporter substrate-binding protein [Psychromonas sp. MB-3u-54]